MTKLKTAKERKNYYKSAELPEEPIVRKPKKKKKVKKSDHKHRYLPCYIIFDNVEWMTDPVPAQYCEICGKVADVTLFSNEGFDSRLPVFHTQSDFFDKVYISL